MHIRNYLLILLVALGCGKNPEEKAAEQNSEPTDNSEEFLSLFKELEPSGLHIYPPSIEDGKLIDSPFNGLEIDVHKYSYLNDDNIFRNIESCKKGQSHIYAVGKFNIDQNTIALLFRQHSQYWESVIELTFWDKNSRTISKGIDLADSFGDEGWYFDLESWIHFKPGSNLEIVARRKDSDYDDETDLTTLADSLSRRVLHDRTFTQASISKGDTALYPLKSWE